MSFDAWPPPIGLQTLLRSLREFTERVGDLDNTVEAIVLTPDDYAGLQAAIKFVERTVDENFRGAANGGNAGDVLRDLKETRIAELLTRFRSVSVRSALAYDPGRAPRLAYPRPPKT